jgi:hypothetical protein
LADYCVPIWLSKWTFKDSRNHTHTLDNHIVKGYDKGSIFTNKEIVNKAVNKLNGGKKKRKLVPVNLTLKSQHGYGVKE